MQLRSVKFKNRFFTPPTLFLVICCYSKCHRNSFSVKLCVKPPNSFICGSAHCRTICTNVSCIFQNYAVKPISISIHSTRTSILLCIEICGETFAISFSCLKKCKCYCAIALYKLTLPVKSLRPS